MKFRILITVCIFHNLTIFGAELSSSDIEKIIRIYETITDDIIEPEVADEKNQSEKKTKYQSELEEIKHLINSENVNKHIRNVLQAEKLYEVLQNEILSYITKPYVCLKTLKGNPSAVTSLCVLHNGNLISGLKNGQIKIWNLETGCCLRTQKIHSEWVSSLCALPDGNFASSNEIIKIWDSNTGKCLKRLDKISVNLVNRLCLLPSGDFASVMANGEIRIWNLTGTCCKSIEAHNRVITSIVVLPNGNFASSSWDGTIKIWDANTFQCLKKLDEHSDRVEVLCVLPRGNLASASRDETIKIWDIESGRCIQTLIVNSSISYLHTLSDGNLLSCSKGEIRTWDPNTGNCLEITKIDTANIESTYLLPNDNLILGLENGTIEIWGRGFDIQYQ